MIAHDIDDALPRLAGIVQEGNRIGETGPQMQQGGRGLSCHAGIAIGRACRYALEQAQHAAYPGLAVQRHHEMHFGRAGIAEADFDTAIGQGMDQGLCAVHAVNKQAGTLKTTEAAFPQEDGLALSYCVRRLRGAVLRQKDPVRGFRRPRIVTMRHWTTSFQKIVALQI